MWMHTAEGIGGWFIYRQRRGLLMGRRHRELHPLVMQDKSTHLLRAVRKSQLLGGGSELV